MLVAYDAASGAREVLANAALLTPEGATTPLAVANYQWSPDRKRALIFTNTKRVWRQNTRGDYWLLDREARTLRKIGGSAPESSLMFATVSPDGSRVAYVRDRDIYLEELASGSIRRLTSDGSDTIVNGTSDWVNEEELDGGKAVTWASEQDGWLHLYEVALDGSGARLLTKFDGDVVDVLSIDVKGGWAYFIASPGSAIERFLYRVKLDGTGSIERVTPAGQRGTHGYQISGRRPLGVSHVLARRHAAGRGSDRRSLSPMD